MLYYVQIQEGQKVQTRARLTFLIIHKLSPIIILVRAMEAQVSIRQ